MPAPTDDTNPTDGAQNPEGAANDAQNPDPKAGETPPWGDDFDAARAWKTITSQREAEKAMKDKLAAFEKVESDKAEAEKTEAEKAADRIAAAEKRASDAERQLLVAKVAKEAKLDDELIEFLTGEDEETMKAQAARLAARVKAPADDVTGRPKPRLTPGTGSSVDDKPKEKAADLAARIRADA